MGAEMDAQLARLYEAARVGWPDYCPSDGLAYLGAERGLERVPTESEAEHRRRLKNAWSIWQDAGSQQIHVDAYGWTGLQNVRVYRRAEFSSPAPYGSPYVRAFARQVWASFDIVIQKPHNWQAKTWGSFNYGDGTVWGSTATGEEVSRLKRFARQFKAGHDTCVYIHVQLGNGPLWGTFKWGDGTRYGGSGTVTRWIVGEDHWGQRGLL
jgi:hypothetical protein